MYWFSTTLLNTHDRIWWGCGITLPLFSETSTDMSAYLVLFNQTCYLVYWKTKRKTTCAMPLHQTCQLTMWNFISLDCYIVNTIYMPCRELLCRCSCNIYACWPIITVANTAAVQKCLLVECCCRMDACCTLATQSACLLTFCHSILHVCWRCASLSAIPADMVSHYQPSLLVWYLTISRAYWRGASL